MDFNQAILIGQLESELHTVLKQVKKLKGLTIETLTQRPGENSWNALEIVEHLNLYSNFYVPEIAKAVRKGKKWNGVQARTFKPGWLGNYFAQSMLPSEQGVIKNPMNTFKSKDTKDRNLDKAVLVKFCDQHEELLSLLKACKEIDLNRVRTSISISSFIRLKLGDTLRFYVNHELRHLIQLDNCLAKVRHQESTSSI